MGLLEHVTQLQFAKFSGLDALLRSVENNAVRVLNIDAQENSKLMMPDALRRWALADEERNIRVNYVRLFLKPQNGVDIIDLNLDYMRQITQQVKGRGYKIGVAGVFQKPGDTDASANGNPGFAGSYDPDRKALLLVALGAWSALALYMGMILPSCKGTKQYLLVIAGMLITAYSLFMGRGLSIRQGLAFLSAVLYPVLSISVILTLWENIKTDTKSTAGVFPDWCDPERFYHGGSAFSAGSGHLPWRKAYVYYAGAVNVTVVLAAVQHFSGNREKSGRPVFPACTDL